jgi:hypothetical protein
MRLVPRLASIAAVAALAAAALGGPAAATANAATATLSFAYTGCVNSYGTQYDYTMRVQGTTGYYSSGMRVEMRLWGEDQWYDDLLVGPISQSYDWGGFYSIDFCVNRSTLDEDWEGRDELYAGVRIYDRATGAQREKVESNRLYGYW